jgi:hypothetical protein
MSSGPWWISRFLLSTFYFRLPTLIGAATEEIESEQTSRIPENLKNKHFPVNPE